MAHSLLKSLLLYFAFAVSIAAFAAPSHLDQTESYAGDSRRSREESNAVRKRVTNATRFARGLPPLAPRRLYKGSQAGSAHQARSSPVPLSVPGILVYGPGSNGLSSTFLGYISTEPNSDLGTYYLTRDCVGIQGSLLFGALTSPVLPNEYPNVGFTVDLGSGPTFSTDTSNFAFMSATAATPDGPFPVSSAAQSVDPDSEMLIESSIWSLTTDDELILTWINPNGEAIPVEIGYVSDWDNAIIITGSISALNLNGNAGEAVPIRLYRNTRGCQR